jgi:ribonuclease HII
MFHRKTEAIRFGKRFTTAKNSPPSNGKILFPIIQSQSIFGVGEASAEEIDALNILQATFLAMQRAVSDMTRAFSLTPDLVLVDGNRLPPALPCPAQFLVKGDSLSVSIASASILAKVTRDKIMADPPRRVSSLRMGQKCRIWNARTPNRA